MKIERIIYKKLMLMMQFVINNFILKIKGENDLKEIII